MTFDKYIPSEGKILFKKDDKDTQTAEGLYIAHSEGEKTEAVAIKGTVLSTGAETIAVGDIIYVSKWEVHQVTIDGQPYYVCKESDVLLREDNA